MIKEFKNFLRKDDFIASITAFSPVPFFCSLSIKTSKLWTQRLSVGHVIFFGIAGILIGAFLGYQIYYRWIFPEKRNPKEC